MSLLNFTQAQLDSIIAAINSRAKKSEAVLLTSVGAASGVASLGADSKIPSAQIPAATTTTLGGVKVSLSGTTLTITV